MVQQAEKELRWEQDCLSWGLKNKTTIWAGSGQGIISSGVLD